MEIIPGTVFDTEVETGCKAIELPDEFGNFGAIDSEGIECTFNTVMVLGHPDHIKYMRKNNK